MNYKKENDILERTLSIADESYEKAYQFLQDQYAESNEKYGPQVLYFLACLAGGLKRKDEALKWLEEAIKIKRWWYRPEVLEDDDLELLKDDKEFIHLKSLSSARYKKAFLNSEPKLFSWEEKPRNNLFLAVHGNTQNAKIAKSEWTPLFRNNNDWQIKAVQSGEPDSYGTYRWSSDKYQHVSVALVMNQMRGEGYKKIVCGGFSSGCDMLLRAVTFTPATCDALLLQSPWIPCLKECEESLFKAIKKKNIEVQILCGNKDKDCLPLAMELHSALQSRALNSTFILQQNTFHQFPNEIFYTIDKLLEKE